TTPTATFWQWPRGQLTIRTFLFRPSRRKNSNNCRTIRIFHFSRVLSVPLIRRARPSRSQSESRRSRPAPFVRTIFINASLEFRLATRSEERRVGQECARREAEVPERTR